MPAAPPPLLYVDADGCPVKEEVFRVALRYGLQVVLVAGAPVGGPRADWIRRVHVASGLDAADDWIAEHVADGDVVVTADIPLAARCVARGARAVSPRGRVLDADVIGEALAMRDLSTGLREGGVLTGGPAAFGPEDRARFLQRLDEAIQAARRRAAAAPPRSRRAVNKVLVYLTRGPELLVFEHVHHPAAGLQVPAGTLALGERPAAGALRELAEETGVAEARVVGALGRVVYDPPDRPMERHIRHVFHVAPTAPTPARWHHVERHASDGVAVELECFWLPIDQAARRLAGAQGALLGRLSPRAGASGGR